MTTISTAVQTSRPGVITREPGVVRDGRTDPENRAPESRGELPRDLVSVSATARRLFATDRDEAPDQEGKQPDARSAEGSPVPDGAEASDAAPGEAELTPEEQAEVAELKARDAEVRAHEQAHLASLGGEGGAASFTYTTGPDGRQYATGGEVPVSIAPVSGDPDATIQRARRIVRAALAPAQPSAADFQAAAKARQLEAEARQEKSAQEDAVEGEGEARRSSEAPAARAAPVALEASFGVGQGGRLEVDHLHPESGGCPHCG